MSESAAVHARREKRDEAIRAGDGHMERVEMWAEGLGAVEDGVERQVRLRGMARHAERAAEAYAGAPYPWGTALAEVARGHALAGLAAAERGDGQAELMREAVAACGRSLEQAEAAGQVRLGAAAALFVACGEVLAQVHALQEGDPAAQRALEEQMAVLGEAAGEALAWEGNLHQEGVELAWMAEVAEAVADLEADPQARLQAAASYHALAKEGAEALWQTLDTEGSDEAIALLLEARAAHASAQEALPRGGPPCPRCGAATRPGKAYCTACGASLAGVQADAPTLAPAEGYLAVVDGPTAGQRHRLGDGLRIGRGEDNDLVLGLSLASRHHAEVRRAPGGYAIVDLGSRNGTYLNGARIEGAARLRDGDTVTIGGVGLRLELAPGASPARYCTSCGAPVAGSQSFCTQCGARVYQARSEG